MMNLKCLFILFGLALLCPAYAQHIDENNKVINITSLKQEFLNPPVNYRMLQITHQPRLDGTLDSLKKYGYGGVVSNVGFSNYLQDEGEWQLFLDYMKKCRSLGMDFWLYDEKGYPSGKAGVLTLQGHPEYETIGIVCKRTEGEGTLSHTMPSGKRYTAEPLFICAAPVRNGLYDFSKHIDLTGSNIINHTLVWAAPDKKEWGILSFHIKRMYEGTHIVSNVSDTNRYINVLDKDAVARFITLTHDAYKNRAPEEMAKYVHAIFTDEPSLMTSYLKDEDVLLPAIPWSRTFRDEFREKYGYDLVPYLPFLFEDCGSETVYKRLDYWGMVSSLIEKNYYGQIQTWCRANGPAASGHTLLEESLYWHAVYEGNLYRDLRRMDLPGLDMLTSDPMSLARSTQIPVPKFVSSVTHMIGKWENMSETSCHYERTSKIPVSFDMRLAAVGYQYALGLTRVTSYYGYDEFSDKERRLFNDYVGRLGLVLSKGKHMTDVAVYYPIQTQWGYLTPTRKTTWEPPDPMRTEAPVSVTKNDKLYLYSHIISYKPDLPIAQRVDAAFGEVSGGLLAGQTDFDYLDDQAILEATVTNGKLEIAGETFCCLVLPETRIIPLSTYRKITDFITSGGYLVTLGKLPAHGMSEQETKVIRRLSKEIGKSKNVKQVTQIHEVQPAVRSFVESDVSLDIPCPELFYNHRGDDHSDIYFLINLSDQPATRNITFNAAGLIEKWDPLTGMINPVSGNQVGHKTTISLHLKPLESKLIIFKR
jgi:hypothetical protein